MRTDLPNVANLIYYLQDFMETVYDREGKRKKRAVSRINLTNCDWSEAQASTFETFKRALVHQTTLVNRYLPKSLIVYTDA